MSPWTAAHQAPLSTEFSRQKYWSGLPFPSPGDLPDPGTEPTSPALQADALLTEPPGKPCLGSMLQVLLLQQPWNPISAFSAQQVYLCNGILLSHKKEWNPDTYNMNVSRDYHTTWSKSEKDIYKISPICGILKYWYKWTYLENRKRLTDIENKVMDTRGEGERGIN